jgi:hypothetical protein
MASKKKTTKPPKSTDVEEVFLEPLQLEKVLRREAQLKVAMLRNRVAELEWHALVAKRTSDAKVLNVELERAKKAYTDLMEEIGKTLSISMKEYGYDSETGKLSKLP